jgi:hypothetical protein
MKILRSLFVITSVLLAFGANAQEKKIQKVWGKLKHGKGLAFTSRDSSMHLKIGFRFQTKFETSGGLKGDKDWSSNFLIRRARLKFDGWAFSPKLVYKVELAFSPNDLKATKDYKEAGGAAKVILDAALKWKFHKNFALWVGQTKLPGNRQRLVSSQKLQLVDRGQVNSIFNIDRDIGLQLHSNFKLGGAVIRPIVAVSKGEGRNIISNNIGGFNYTGKIEILPMGKFTGKGDYFEADLKREPTPKLSIAGAFNYNDRGAREKATGVFMTDTNGVYLQRSVYTAFADLMFKYKGFSLFAEFAMKDYLFQNGETVESIGSEIVDADENTYLTGNGILIQAGYLFKNNIELAGRFTTVTPSWKGSFDGLREYTLGLSKYVVGHSLKIQTDITLVDKFDSPDPTLRYRLQVELGF